MQEIFQTAFATLPELSTVLPIVSVLVFLYLLYKVFGQKDSEMIETLTSSKILVPALIFLGLALAPAGSLAVFGGFQAAISVILAVVTAIIVPMLIAAVIVWVVKAFAPRYL